MLGLQRVDFICPLPESSIRLGKRFFQAKALSSDFKLFLLSGTDVRLCLKKLPFQFCLTF